MTKERNSTLEILRIVSMMMVLSLHYMNPSFGGGLNTESSTNLILAKLIESISITSVNVFVLISGYFMINSKTTGLKKAIDLYLIMVVYKLVFFFGLIIFGKSAFTVKSLLKQLFPFLRGDAWFLETYIIFILFVPFLNKLIFSLNKKSHALLLIIQLLLFCVWPTFLPSAPITDAGYGIINFITLYLIISYIRRYVNFDNKKKTRVFSLLTFVLAVTVIFAFCYISYLSARSWDYCNLFNIIASVSIVILFLNLPEMHNKFINVIASTTFGVYLLHGRFYELGFTLKIMKIGKYINTPYFILNYICCVLIQFIVCSLIDYIRQLVWKPTVGKLLNSSKLLKREQEWEKEAFENE